METKIEKKVIIEGVLECTFKTEYRFVYSDGSAKPIDSVPIKEEIEVTVNLNHSRKDIYIKINSRKDGGTNVSVIKEYYVTKLLFFKKLKKEIVEFYGVIDMDIKENILSFKVGCI